MYRIGARCQKLPKFAAFAPSFKETKVNDDGSVEEVDVPSNKPLPDSEMFDLKNVLDAGIPLQHVNTKVINPSFGDFAAFANSEELEDPDLLKKPETQTTTTTTPKSEV